MENVMVSLTDDNTRDMSVLAELFSLNIYV